MKINDIPQEELADKLASGEIDLYDLDLIDIDWSGVHYQGDEEDEEVPTKPKKQTSQQPQGVPKYFLVKLRLNNGRVYEWAKVPVRAGISVDDHAAEIYFDFFQKLNKRYVHIRKPVHRAIRCSIVDELSVEPVF